MTSVGGTGSAARRVYAWKSNPEGPAPAALTGAAVSVAAYPAGICAREEAGPDPTALPSQVMWLCKGSTRTAYTIVRFRAKPGREKDLIEAERQAIESGDFPGLRKAVVVKTGDRDFCSVGEWDSFDSIANARPAMIASLDTMRDMMEDLGGGLGVTDPVSGEVVLEKTR